MSMTGGFDSFRLPNCSVDFETTHMARYLFPTQTVSPLCQAGVRATCAVATHVGVCPTAAVRDVDRTLNGYFSSMAGGG